MTESNLYQRHQKIRATKMTLADYNAIRAWESSEDESGDAEGYLVEYLEEGNPNVHGYDNYISWYRKEQFDIEYSSLNVELDTTELPKQIKVDPKHIESLLDSLTYQHARMGTSTTTVCSASLPIGFSVGIGTSGCVVYAEFNVKIGEKYAQENALEEAKSKLWELEGYLLKITGHTSEYFK